MGASQPTYDLLIIGGGINGTGIARDAAGRGLSVALCEMDDLASATSSRSSKLIHGGLRYLEQAEFRLVREALAEREVLLGIAPHIIWPLRFRLPVEPELRSPWQIRIGLWLYDHLARLDQLPPSTSVTTEDQALKDPHQTAFEYSDAWVDDARLVVLNAKSAQQAGATILTRHRCTAVTRNPDHWLVTLQNLQTGETHQLQSKALVNAAGPWVEALFHSTFKLPAAHGIRLVKGSHIVVPRLHDQPHAYILQNPDRRIVFVLPYEEQFSLIGTTDVDYEGPPEQVCISPEETGYLLETVNQHFTRQLVEDDIAYSFAGVRPLLEDEKSQAQTVTRDYTLELDGEDNQPPLLSVFGGKITTYRKLAESAMTALTPYFPDMGGHWTGTAPLPGGDIRNPETFATELQQRYPWLPAATTARFSRSYGSLSHRILDTCHSLDDMGQHFGAGLYQREVDYLVELEWAQTVEDILWRRTKRGLFFTPQQVDNLERYLSATR